MVTVSPYSRKRYSRKQVAQRIGALVVGAALLVSACGGVTTPRRGTTFLDFLVSYSGAASRMDGMEPTEATEQVRDWTRTALAAHLNLDTAHFRDESYDTLPVRDQAFADLARQQVGPGRSLLDGHGVLHLLVPRGDPHEGRTVGLLLDQFRTDHGSDPQRVQIHRYQQHADVDTVEVTADKPEPTAAVRAAHGYVSMRVDQAEGLRGFLAKTQSLSRLSVRGSQIWADGWHWPDARSVPLDATDVSVLQRGYGQSTAGPTPGFSLDPVRATTADEVKAVIPGLDRDLAQRILSDNWAGSSFRSVGDVKSAVDGALLQGDPAPSSLPQRGLPADRTQLWTVHELLAKEPIYSKARYDGGLAGTSVGMTLFYGDLVAKDWVAGVGDGVPSRAVGGFVPDSDAVTPWSHCPGPGDPKDESGRLWFGQNDSGFSAYGDSSGGSIDIGASATRLFARTNGPNGGEIEPSFAFGRGLYWFDQHQQAVADYEPEFARLEEIMRWSGALEWLVKQHVSLPETQDKGAQSNLTFKEWYARHSELRERSPVDFVAPPDAKAAPPDAKAAPPDAKAAPPNAKTEAVVTKPTKTYGDCGGLRIEGGVSLANADQRTGGKDYHPDVPEPERRAGTFDPSSHLDQATGDGEDIQVALDGPGQVSGRVARRLTTSINRAVTRITASGRAVIPFGNVKLYRAASADRELVYETSAGQHDVSQHVDYQGQDLGTLDVRDTAGVVGVEWRRGPMDRVRALLTSIQRQMSGKPFSSPPLATDGALYTFQRNDGHVLYRIGGPGASWLDVSSDAPAPPDGEVAFRLGAPDPHSGGTRFFEARFANGPPDIPHEPMTVSPETENLSFSPPDRRPRGKPPRVIKVEDANGRTTTITVVDNKAYTTTDDPILGLNGSEEGAALLRDFPVALELLSFAANASTDFGNRVGPDGVVLASGDEIRILPNDSPLAERVIEAVQTDPTALPPRVRIKNGRAEIVDDGAMEPIEGSGQVIELGELMNVPRADQIVIDERLRAPLHLQNGPIVASHLSPTFKVRIARVRTGRGHSYGQGAQPDVRLYPSTGGGGNASGGGGGSGGGEYDWVTTRIVGFTWVTGSPPTSEAPTETPTATPASSADVSTPALANGGQTGQVLLVCPVSGPGSSACEV